MHLLICWRLVWARMPFICCQVLLKDRTCRCWRVSSFTHQQRIYESAADYCAFRGWNWERTKLSGPRRRKQCSLLICYAISRNIVKGKGKALPLQAMLGPEGSRKLRLLDFLTTAQYGGRFSALPTGRLYPQGYSWYSFSLGAESTPGPWFNRKEIFVVNNESESKQNFKPDIN